MKGVIFYPINGPDLMHSWLSKIVHLYKLRDGIPYMKKPAGSHLL